MRVALLSDAHLQGPGDPNQARLLRFLASLEVDRVCLLGDIFQHWWHFGAEPFPAYAPVVDALRRFPLTFVPGNHDFHAARYFADVLGAEVAPNVAASWDGLEVQLSHGDEVDLSFGYRALSAALRGRVFAAAMDGLGPERAWRVLRRISGQPQGAPDASLCDAQIAAAAARAREGRQLVVSGHTHAPGVHAVPGGTYVNLGDWVRWHTWLLVEQGEATLFRRGPDDRDTPFAGEAAML